MERNRESALKSDGSLSSDQIDLLSHYASVYADHPANKWIGLNNLVNPFCMLFYRSDIDYSGTEKSQTEDGKSGLMGVGYNYNIWHSMRSPDEAKENSISEEDAMQRGLQFGWGKIFESASNGRLSSFRAMTQVFSDLVRVYMHYKTLLLIEEKICQNIVQLKISGHLELVEVQKSMIKQEK
jgi:hypothetical protein